MAKQAAATAVAVKEEDQLPDYLRDYTGPLGTEDLGKTDVKIPQILIGEAVSDAVKDKLVNEGDLYLNVDLQTLVPRGEALPVVVVGRGSEVLLWRDRDDNSGEDRIMARAKRVQNEYGGFFHRWDKPNTPHATKFKGEVPVTHTVGEVAELDGLLEFGSANPSNPDCKVPAATKHYNYVLYLPTLGLVTTISLSKTRAAAAENFNTTLKMSDKPIWAREFNLTSVQTAPKGAGGDRWNTVIFTANGLVEADVAEVTRKLFEEFSDKGFEVDRSGETGDAAPATDDGLV